MGNKRSLNDEPAKKKKEYTQEQYNKKKRKTFKLAKISYYSGKVMYITGVNLGISLVLFLVLVLGTSLLPHIMNVTIDPMDFSPETFWCRGGIFTYFMLVFLPIFGITGLTYAWIFKITEILCILLDGELEGAMEVDDAAARANLKGQAAKVFGMSYVDAQALSGPMAVMVRYCIQNNKKMINPRFFKVLNKILIAVQILIACVCFCCFVAILIN